MHKADKDGETMKEIDREIYEWSEVEMEASRTKAWTPRGSIWERFFSWIERTARKYREELRAERDRKAP